jgi:Tfp pilus assembly protein PilN
MRKTKKINVNLASHPLRNRRFFFLITGILVFLLCVFSTLAGYTYWVYNKKNRDYALTKTQIEKKMQDALREDRKLTMLIDEASQKYSDRIDFINTLIYRKSFSWVDFLSALEDSLPETCYVVSMAPSLKDNSKMEVRLKIAAPNLDELLKLNKNLYEKHFTNIRIISESRDEAGMLISEISLVYERTV